MSKKKSLKVAVKHLFYLMLLMSVLAEVQANVNSISGNLDFELNSVKLMQLNSRGLAVGATSPMANLHVLGNALITGTLGIGTSTPNANLQIAGTLGFSSNTMTASGNSGNYSVIFVDTDTLGANVEVKLPYASTVQGRMVTIKKMSNNHVVSVSHGGLIDGAYSSIQLSSANTNFPSVNLLSSGNEYYILNQNPESSSNLSFKLEKISNCVVWLDGSDASTITVEASGNVSSWRDKSGRGLNFAASGNYQPSRTTSWRNGLSAMTFNPNFQQYIRSTTNLSFSDSGVTIFLVLDNNTTSAEINASVFNVNGTNNPTLWVQAKANAQILLSSTHSGNGTDSTASVTASKNIPYVVEAWFSLAQNKKYINVVGAGNTTKTNADDADLGLALLSTSQDAWVGCQKINNGTAPQYRCFGGNVGEILMYDRKLEDAEIAMIRAYLKGKWSL